ncbi:AMP-binding protein [Sphaerisporangium aureirubrum]|uniref:AMP-binding protein n=1 Tax=Sphaerisporangium aureirubrum TaxID=1544736 RepID=A0ABW1NL79_9ACTN
MEPEVLTDTLLARADRTPDVVAYESADPLGPVSTLTYAQVAARASVLAERLASVADGPVLLACPAGLDYVVAVFGAFLAGRPVIPAFPPGTSSRSDGDRLAGIVADARPPVVVAPQRYAEITTPAALSVPGAEADGAAWRRPRGTAGSDVAVIQYTSGSTGRPRGVLVRHDSLAANTAAIVERFELHPDSRGLTWLPPFHDMGLVGGLLTPMAAGIPMRIMQPGDFLKAPLWWLTQISETGTTHTGGPNFGYDLCVRRARGGHSLDGIDLSRWRVAFSGGETVRHRTMADFARRFASAGFRAEAFLPCYGLAEATLIVSAGHWSEPAAGAADAAVSCGTPVRGQRVVVVDRERHLPVDEGLEGEIWIAGPNVTPGYLSGDSGGLFGELDGTRFLRTGDLGYVHDGDLFVSGRIKDVIVFRGVNHHAVDVEVAALDAAGNAGRMAAAFLVDTGPEPLPVLLLETHGRRDETLTSEVRAAVLARTGLRLGVVAVLPPRSLPRTSSGKIRRSAAREAFLAGFYDDVLPGGRAALAVPAGDSADDAAAGLSTVICGIVAAVCEADDCRPADNLIDLGVDSVRAAEAAAVLENALGLTVPLETILAVSTPADAAKALVADWLAQGQEPGLIRDRVITAGDGVGVV